MNDKTPRVGSLEYAETQKSYVPKVGDKVRATLGENVLVGRIDFRGEIGFSLLMDVLKDPEQSVDGVWLWDSDLWRFEQVVSVPTKFGAVIRRADGVLLSLQDTKNRDNRWLAPSDNWQWCDDADATAGGFTVLFDGVDE